MNHVTTLLTTNKYIRVIALDFSKAFDTVRHSSVLSKLSELPINDNVFNWFVDYFQDHNHRTKVNQLLSNTANINSSVFQGSAVGPPLFLINSHDLKPQSNLNFLDKYADDTYLIVGSSNEHTLQNELMSIESWAKENNLSLNKKKSQEILFSYGKTDQGYRAVIPEIPGISRVEEITILGVTIRNNFSISSHISNITESAAQSLYAIKTLKNHGLKDNLIQQVFNSTCLSRLTYCISAWWGFTTEADKQKLQALINKGIRWKLCNAEFPSIIEINSKHDETLFKTVLNNEKHVLHQFLPPKKNTPYSLRKRVHDRTLPRKSTVIEDKNFFNRMLLKNTY